MARCVNCDFVTEIDSEFFGQSVHFGNRLMREKGKAGSSRGAGFTFFSFVFFSFVLFLFVLSINRCCLC